MLSSFSLEAALTQQVSELESRPQAGGGVTTDLRGIRRERDELKEAVKNFEDELKQIQADTQMLAEDRDNFKLLYEQVSKGGSSQHSVWDSLLLFPRLVRNWLDYGQSLM